MVRSCWARMELSGSAVAFVSDRSVVKNEEVAVFTQKLAVWRCENVHMPTGFT
jgi:hypothetical protein